jgi:hypothetical protein
VIQDKWKLDLLSEILGKGWSDIYCVATSSSERKEEEYTTRTYAYKKNDSCFKQVWHDDFIGSQWKLFKTIRYWDDPIRISVEAFKRLSSECRRVDTAQNKINLDKQLAEYQEQQDALQAEEKQQVIIPKCPVCKKKMIERTNRKNGGLFWGCCDYPECNATRHHSGWLEEK